MYTKTLLLALSTTATLSLAAPEAAAAHRAIKKWLAPRQTASLSIPPNALPSDDCLNALASIASELPAAPTELASITVTDACKEPELAPTVAPIYSSYSSALNKWYTDNSADIFQALSECPELSSLAGDFTTLTDGICESTSTSGSSASESTSGSSSGSGSSESVTSTTSGSSAAPSASGSDTPSGTAGGGAQSSGPSSAFAPRETGFVGAAIAAAGFIGVVAVL